MKRQCVNIPTLGLFGVLAALLILQPPVLAQTIYGSVAGSVRDSTNLGIPGADVKVTNLATGLIRETITNDAGFFRITALPGGEYSVAAAMADFETVTHERIVVSVSVETTVDFMLRPAGSMETVEVSAEAVLMETNRSQISKTIDSKRIVELPGRQALNGLALLQPGTAPNNNNRPGSGFSVNGGRTHSNNFTIDGANNNDQSLSIPRQTLPTEAIAEFQLITNNFSAEYGRNSGSFVNVITKSGTNEYHGTVQWTWQGNSLDALTTAEKRTFNAHKAAGLDDKAALSRSRGVNVDNLGGATFGGPIKKDHTFFFTSYDRQWFRTTAVPSPTIAISPAGLANLQANSSAFAPGALNFLTNTFPTANDPTPRGLLRVTLPNSNVVDVPLQQFNRSLTGSFPYGRDFYRFMGKFDSQLTDNDTLSGRYLIDDLDDPGTPSAIPGQEIGSALRNQSVTFNEIHVFGPRTVNEARFTYARRSVHFPESLPPSFAVSGFNSVGNANFPQFRTDNMYEWTNNLSHSMRNHTLKTGVNVLRYQLNSFFAPNSRGSVSYPSLTDFLLDQNANFSQYAGDGFVPARTTELGVFIQDDFRIMPDLTLNLGVRYEYTSAPFGFFSNAEADTNNWAPRLGFAWRPTFDGGFLQTLFGNRTVFRGGYAISYDQVFQNILLNNARNFPRGVTVAIGPISGQRLYEVNNRPAPPTPDDFVKGGGNVNLLPIRLYSPDKRIEQPYGQQFSLGFERQFQTDYIVRVYYVGSRGINLVREVERNIGFSAAAVAGNPATFAPIIDQLKPVHDAAGNITAYRVDPTRGSILVGDGLAQSSYHSLQLTFEKRFSKNLQFQANYTYSSFVNDSDDILGGQTNSTLPAVPFNTRLDRGRSGFDQPHRFVANYIYQFPNLFADRAVWNGILGGWQVSGITTLAEGTPFTVFNANNALGILPGQIGTVAGSQRASIDPNGIYPLPTSAGVTNPFYIANPTNSGLIGNAGRNIERTGTTYLFDMALVKNVKTFKRFGEDHGLQFRWEVFNVFSHRNFTVIPASTVSSTTNVLTFLNLGQTNVPGRSMLFTLRYSF